MFVKDVNNELSFLVDSGSDVSIIAKRYYYKLLHKTVSHSNNPRLIAANNKPLRTFGNVQLQLDLGLARTYFFEFIIADSPYNIIGADFLSYFNLTIKLHSKELHDPYLNTTVKSISQISKFSNVSLFK